MSRWHTSKNPWTRGFAPEGKGERDAAPGGFGFCRRGYHHGNLKEALIEAARQLAAERGPHGFTLVEAARLAQACLLVTACGRTGDIRAPGPPEQITFPRTYPAPDRAPQPQPAARP